ncbi:hypothetical protein EUV02_03955 [Polymorphobacter arshaanensis]|uniref:Uncharacterized protein n=1 Tax=Glacieibacterium arshaanense TaxID=2511025 RepID=A0A4Y9ERC5_9SPHN|nr:hypothetical protein [Polymorphobacter arshaanensis]TFU06175.1 hypothetical protein EUV02_03955 [Polymorphobacter arshaanensis]
MATIPVRRLGSAGIVADMHPADIEEPAVFTAGVNVRFSNGRASRAPVARTVATLPISPGHVLTIPPGAAGYDEIVIVSHDFGSILHLNGLVYEDLTPPGQTGIDGLSTFTSTYLGGVSYINRDTHAPVGKAPGDGTYLSLPDWAPEWRCKSLRAYKDFLIALGVTKGGAYYPTMVKWSDLTGFGAPPASWDSTITTNSAGENIVNEMQHAIVDGASLRDSFILYCTSSVWTMNYIGGNLLFDFRKLYDECGVINTNCVVQVDGMHYVFDKNDIWIHDGATKTSIADQKVKNFIFDALDYSKANLCFVSHDAKLTEVRFMYPSVDRLVGFANPETGCNRAAVYNYGSKTWSFYDVPNVTSGTKAAIISGKTWEDAGDTSWDDLGGSWTSVSGDEASHMLLVSRMDTNQGLSADRLYGFDTLTGGRLPIPPEPEALRPAFLERTGLDLDALGKHLTQYVRLQAMWPQVYADDAKDIYWQFGANDLVGKEPQWSVEMPFDPDVDGKIDINEAGKYLGYRFGVRGISDFKLSGFDIEMTIRGRR